MATVSIIVNDKPEGGVSIQIDTGDDDGQETGAQIVGGILTDMLEHLIETMNHDAELSKVRIED